MIESPSANAVTGPSGRLHVDHGGTGEMPIVFVHSYAGSAAHWTNQIAHLRPSRRAVALDLRGHGQSDPPASGSYAIDSLAGDIAAVVDTLGLERFVLVGHSMGGSAAIAYAGAHPDRVAGLVLVGTPGPSPPEQAKQIMSAMEANYDGVAGGYWTKLLTGAKPEVEQQVRADMANVPREPSLAMIREVFAYDPMPALRAHSGPKLLIDTPHGESPSAIHHLLPEIPRRVIEGTSHWPQLDKPAEFNSILDEFLRSVH